jgi:ABC-type xylose transport system substrate-binding protein
MINGDDADPNAAQFKEGAHKVLDGKVDIAYEQSGLWKDTVAAQKMSAAITQLGAKNIAGVYAANDGMAGGIANTLKGAKISGIPLTGQDAELAGIQRIVAGTQSSTVYKAFKPEAEAAAQLAVDLLNGKDIKGTASETLTSGSGDKVPSQLLTPVSVTKANIKDTVVKDGLYTVAAQKMTAAITQLGAKNIAGVYSANDGMAGGIITALKAAGITVPVTGQDAELAAVQRIVTGEQYMSVYKPYAPEADAAAEMAVALAQGKSLDSIAKDKVDSGSAKGIPAVLVPVTSLTKDNINDTVIKDGVYTADEICTGKYKAACDKAGVTG